MSSSSARWFSVAKQRMGHTVNPFFETLNASEFITCTSRLNTKHVTEYSIIITITSNYNYNYYITTITTIIIMIIILEKFTTCVVTLFN